MIASISVSSVSIAVGNPSVFTTQSLTFGACLCRYVSAIAEAPLPIDASVKKTSRVGSNDLQSLVAARRAIWRCSTERQVMSLEIRDICDILAIFSGVGARDGRCRRCCVMFILETRRGGVVGGLGSPVIRHFKASRVGLMVDIQRVMRRGRRSIPQ